MIATNDFLLAMQERLSNFESDMLARLQALYLEGALTAADKAKIDLEISETKRALLQSLSSEDYAAPFQEEWALRIEQGYREHMVARVKAVEARRYTDAAIRARIGEAKAHALATLYTPQQVAITRAELAKSEKQLWRDIHGVCRRHARRAELIEQWLGEFERHARMIASGDRFSTLPGWQ